MDTEICLSPLAPIHSVDAILDKIVEILVLPHQSASRQISLSPFSRFQKEMTDLHMEVQFCLWAMNVSLSVYMRLLSLVDIRIRQEISGVVSKFLSEWKGSRDQQLSKALDDLIVNEFKNHNILEIPDTELIQQDKGCQLLCSTVESYIKDIAIKLDSSNGNDLDSTIDIVFPPSKNFIGRFFFPRLALVSYKIMELIKSKACSLCELDSDFSSNDSTQSFTESISAPVACRPHHWQQ